MNEMESPVVSETSLSVLCALTRSRRSRSPGAPDADPAAGRTLLAARPELLADGGEVQALDLPQLLDLPQPLHVGLRVDPVPSVRAARTDQALLLPQSQRLRSEAHGLRNLAYGEPHRTAVCRQPASNRSSSTANLVGRP